MGSESDKKKKQKASKNNMKNRGGGTAKDGGGGGKNITDDRFASAQSDPRFMEAPKKRSKVEIDSRFSRVFTDKKFTSSNARIDKRGKRKNNDNNAASSLSHYYRLQQQEEEKKASPIKEKEEEEDEEDSDPESESDKIGDETETESEKLNENIEDSDDDVQSIDDSSSTSTGSDSDSDGQFTDEEEDELLQPEENVPEIDKETKRLAVVNLDWSHVRAVDLYVLLSSFLPKGGQIVSVSVYPSEFGLKRMEEEAVRGPVGLFDEDEEESDDEDDDEIDNTKLRAYELSRLRYYYAVVECDSIATADYLYKNCDGVEFERSANKLDMRFIPDSMEFKHQPRDTATEAPADYEGVDFQTRALQHSNIHLTWDEDEPQRTKTLKRKLNDGQLAELELKEFLASDESESDEEDNVDDTEDKSLKKCNKRDKYRALVQSGDGSDEDGEDDSDDNQDMEVTFSTGLEDISKRILEKKNKEAETVWDAYLRKRKEKKQASKKRSKYSSSDDEGIDHNTDKHTDKEQIDDFFVEEPSAIGSTKKGKSGEEKTEEAEATTAELELLAGDDNAPDNLKGYNLKPKKNKGKKGKGVLDESKIPTFDEDPRFSAVFKSQHFAIDPTDPQFKRSATYVRQVAKKQKIGDKKNEEQTDPSEIPDESSMQKRENVISDEAAKRKEKYELSSLVKSIKMKSKNLSLASKATVPQKRTNLQHKAKRQI